MPEPSQGPDKDAVLAALTGRFADFFSSYAALRPDGGQLRGKCPIHKGDGPNFTISPETGHWMCHSRGCGKPGGDIFGFVMLANGLTFPEALERMAAYAGLSADVRQSPRPPRRPSSKQPVSKPPAAADGPFLDGGLAEELHRNLMAAPKVRAWLLEHRGLTTETLERFQIGLKPSPSKGGEWRITFPVLDPQGRLTNIRKHLFAYKEGLDRTFKTLPWEKGLRAELFPLAALDDGQDVLVVEGEPDAVLACQMGLVALTGTGGAETWKPEWTEALRGRRVTLLYDGDEAGQRGAARAARALASAAASVRVAAYPANVKDLTEWVVNGGATAEAVRAAIEAGAVKRDFACTDVGNGQRLAVRHGADLHYCHPWEKWLIWDGQRWQKDDTGEIDRRAKETAQHIFQEAADCPDTAKQTELGKHALRSQSHARLQSMIALANSEPGVPARVSEWDKNPWLLAVDNGTIDLKTGELRESQRGDMGTKRAGTRYDPEAAAPRWEAFLETVLPDPAARAFFQRAAGYTLTGDVSAQCLFFLYGSGSNGKSTALRALMDAMGDYALQAAPDLLIAREGAGGPNNDVAELQGTRLVATIEVEDGKRMAEGLVKQITGGDRIKARFMRQDFFEFEPTHKIFLAANHKPAIRGQDIAIWRRIKVLPFEVQIADTDKDPHLPEKLRAERPGILAWAVRGCLDWQRQGLAEPAAVKEATAAYQAGEDVLGDFLGECCLLRPALRVTAASLYIAYVKWAEENSERSLSKKTFGTRLQEGRRIFPGVNIGPKNARGWEGIGLLDTESGAAFDGEIDKLDKSDPKKPMNGNLIESRGDYLENTSNLSILSKDVLAYLIASAPAQRSQIVAAMRARGHAEEETKHVITRLQQQERRIEFDVSAGGYVLAALNDAE